VTLGYLYMALSLASFSLIGIMAKVGDTKRCRPPAICAAMYGWALVVGALFVFAFRQGDFHSPAGVYLTALPFGASSAIAIVALQSGIRYGKISTSWLIINLSAAIPTAGSLIFYHEPVSGRKVAILALIAVSVFLLWKDKQSEEGNLGGKGSSKP
jgi:drug/metabolite transporter (DMT)-like permease